MLTSCRQFLNFGATLFMIYKYNRHNINIIMPWQIFPSRIHLKNVLSRWHILKSKSFHPNSDYNENICDKLLVQYFLFFEFFISCIGHRRGTRWHPGGTQAALMRHSGGTRAALRRHSGGTETKITFVDSSFNSFHSGWWQMTHVLPINHALLHIASSKRLFDIWKY